MELHLKPIKRRQVLEAWDWKDVTVPGFDGDTPVEVEGRIKYISNGRFKGAKAIHWIFLHNGTVIGEPYGSAYSHIEWESSNGERGIANIRAYAEVAILNSYGYTHMSKSHMEEDERRKNWWRKNKHIVVDDDMWCDVCDESIF